MVSQVLVDIQDHLHASIVGSGACFALALMSFVNLQLAICSTLLVGGIASAVVHCFL